MRCGKRVLAPVAAAFCDPEKTIPGLNHEDCGGGDIDAVSRMKSSSSSNAQSEKPPPAAKVRLSSNEVESRKRSRYLIVSVNRGLGGLSVCICL